MQLASWTTESNASGLLKFQHEGSPPLPTASVLVLHEPHHGLHWKRVGEESSLGRLTMASASPTRIAVKRRDGTPAAGASIRVLARAGGSETGGDTEPEFPWAIIELPASAEGEALLGRFEGTAWIVAESNGAQSAPWTGSMGSTGQVDLVLRDTISVAGSLITESDSPSDATGVRVTAAHRNGGDEHALGAASVGPELQWTMPELPHYDSGAYEFRLHGPNVIPDVARVPLPHEGHISIALHYRLGAEFEVRVRDHDQKMIADVTVEVRWQEGKDESSVSGRTGSDGKTAIRGVRPGEVQLILSADKFVTTTFGPFGTDALEKLGADLYIQAAGTLRLTCVKDEEPVREFSLRYWKDLPHEVLKKEVVADGSEGITLEDVPLGTVHLFAFTAESAASEIVSVTVDPVQVTEARLELPVPCLASGKVVDAESGFPIPDASLEPHLLVGTARIAACSEAMRSDSGGTFRALPLPAGPCWIAVSAPGYAPGGVSCDPGSTPDFDVGAIELTLNRDLEVRLIGRPEQDLSAYMVDLEGLEQSPRIACDPDGRAVFEKVAAGTPTLSIWPPDTGRQYIELDLRPGERWSIEVPIATDRVLSVRVAPPPGGELEDGMWVGATFRTAEGFRSVRHRRLPLDGWVEFPNVTGREVVVEVLSPEFALLAVEHTSIPDEGSKELQVTIQRDAKKVRFLDPNYEPIAGATVNLGLSGDDTMWTQPVSTDGEGLIEVRGVSNKDVKATLFFGTATVADLPVEFNPDPNAETIVIVDASGALQLQALDGELPLVQAKAGIGTRAEVLAFDSVDADAGGLCKFGSLAPKDYYIEIYGDGLWRTEQILAASSDNPLYEIQVRRVGAIELNLSRDEYPAADMEIDLVSAEFGEKASDWLAAGRIRSSTGEMRTDSTGNLIVLDLPHGAYTWTVPTATGSAARGELFVMPESRVEHQVQL